MCGFVVKPCAARGTGSGVGGGMNQLFKISRHVRSVNWGGRERAVEWSNWMIIEMCLLGCENPISYFVYVLLYLQHRDSHPGLNAPNSGFVWKPYDLTESVWSRRDIRPFREGSWALLQTPSNFSCPLSKKCLAGGFPRLPFTVLPFKSSLRLYLRTFNSIIERLHTSLLNLCFRGRMAAGTLPTKSSDIKEWLIKS